MCRRSVLLTGVSAVTGLSGCNTSPNTNEPTGTRSETDTPDKFTTILQQSPTDTQVSSNEARREIVDTNFEVVEVSDRFDSGNPPPGVFNHHATANFDESNRLITIKGRVLSGSKSCRKLSLSQSYLSPKTQILSVVVFDDYLPPTEERPCTLEQSIIPYIVDIEFSPNIPREIQVVHTKETRVHKQTNTTSS